MLGRQGASYCRRCDPELVLKPAISVKKCWGGYRRTTRVTLAMFRFRDLKLFRAGGFILAIQIRNGLDYPHRAEQNTFITIILTSFVLAMFSDVNPR